ncbi:Rrf2 family transcriptional regulator [Variovorax ginsengisoli]|uniref:Rrf2 family iron-sulfur cluster assembly transcriptional regulator n=1 Tax=Variovorax ginsengisoli TaxID=363844 RepID=A0ABT9SB52_9BURK|nr:Rrf2 family transcriptional regulator [Variovorax ginsengisoli]MDP9900602.1 Rrf2 family iron-sulfur cluster assembly transcriptional regulator [Variovorax ginsengisoli]
MRLTTKGRFAVTAMIDVALHGRSGPVTLSAISQRQHISMSYLEQLFGKLRRHKLVESTRGPGGGYSLARKTEAISVADIVLSIEDPVDEAARQQSADEAAPAGRYATEELWASVNLRAVEFLDSVTLKSLVDDQIAKGVQVETKPAPRRLFNRPAPKPMRVNAPNSVFALGMHALAKR